MNTILVINGPNLDMLGSRQPEVYGPETLADLETGLVGFGSSLGIEVTTFQSNHEGRIIDAIHEMSADGLVINPGALSHTSRAIADSIRGSGIPTVEVHISNIRERESWRAVSVIAEACQRTIYGRGTAGYRAAIRHLRNHSISPGEVVRYGPHPDNVGDLRRGERGLVVLLHGGVWRHQFERDTIESLAVDLHTRGYASWNVEYRRLGAGGGWPGTGHDVLTALDFIPQLGLPSGPLTVIGHSAGGYLGMWAGTRSKTGIDLLVGLAPVVDLDLGVADRGELERECGALLRTGAPPRVDPRPVPTIAVHPIGDSVVSSGHSTGLATRAGIELLQPELGHYDLLDPSKAHWPWVVERLAG